MYNVHMNQLKIHTYIHTCIRSYIHSVLVGALNIPQYGNSLKNTPLCPYSLAFYRMRMVQKRKLCMNNLFFLWWILFKMKHSRNSENEATALKQDQPATVAVMFDIKSQWG